MGAEGGVNIYKHVPKNKRTHRSGGLVFHIDAKASKHGIGRTLFKSTNIHTYNYWDVTSAGGQTGYSTNGASSENKAEVAIDPWGRYSVIWKGQNNDVSSNADGGWNGPTDINIDKTQEYRFTFWTKVESKGTGNKSGRFYFGLHGGNSSTTNAGVQRRSNLANDTNPYFAYPNQNDSTIREGEWFMNCQVVKPSGTSAGFTQPDYVGFYRPDGSTFTPGNYNGNTGGGGVWRSDATRTRSRNYLYYSTDPTVKICWYYPRIDLIDGNEPTVDEMLKYPIDSVYDLSDNGNNLTPYPLTSGPTLNTKRGYWEFNGSDELFIGSETNTLDLTNALSIVAWVNADSLSQNGFIFEKGPVNDAFALFFESGNVTFRTANTSGTTQSLTVTAAAAMSVGRWHNIVATYDGSTKKLYIDGKERASVAYTQTLDTQNSGISVGAYGGQSSNNYYFDGKISSIKVFDYAISEKHIASEFKRKTHRSK